MTSALARDLAAIVGEKHVREARAERLTYSMDGLPTHRRVPDLVVLPGSREELVGVVRIDRDNRLAVVEPGVVNAKLGAAARPHGLQYAPDPSSQSACTIGGNVAENAGGPHCLKYGVTVNHILALE